jgi:putative ABC transport system ATP-binding protein
LPDTGEIQFDGHKIDQKNIRAIRKRIAWLPQNPNIIGRGKVREQILLPFYFKVNKELMPDQKTLLTELEKLNLDASILESAFDEISGGEKQRIGLMICKLLKREVMLLDEPTSALDKENLSSAINYLCAGTNATVLSASHDEDWLNHCDQVIEL